jgi:hypothetical protein
MKTSYSVGLGIPHLRFAGIFSRASLFLGLVLALVAAGLAGCGGGGSISEPDPAPAPTLEIRTGLDGVAAGPFQVDFVFSNDVAGFSQSSLRLQSGTVVEGSFKQVSSRQFAVMINPPANATGVTVLKVFTGSFTSVGSFLTNTTTYEFSKAFDTIQPVTDPAADCSYVYLGGPAGVAKPPVRVTISFSIDVQPLTLDKLVIVGGTASDFTRVSARVYTMVLTPPPQVPPVAGTMTVYVPEGAVTGAVPGGVSNSRGYSCNILYILLPGG